MRVTEAMLVLLSVLVGSLMAQQMNADTLTTKTIEVCFTTV